MVKFHRAEGVFKEFPEDIKNRIFDEAAGKLVYFPKITSKKQVVYAEAVRIQYAENNKSYSQIGDQLGVSKVRICQIANQERKKYSKKRVEYWKKRGLSLREIARLLKKSNETIRQLANTRIEIFG